MSFLHYLSLSLSLPSPPPPPCSSFSDFFERQYLCNSSVWSCEITGQQNLSYQEALDSEREARHSMSLLPEAHKEAILWLLHQRPQTSMKNVIEKSWNFIKERFLVGEELDYYPTPGGEKRYC